jgi:hypothetical protein
MGGQTVELQGTAKQEADHPTIARTPHKEPAHAWRAVLYGIAGFLVILHVATANVSASGSAKGIGAHSIAICSGDRIFRRRRPILAHDGREGRDLAFVASTVPLRPLYAPRFGRSGRASRYRFDDAQWFDGWLTVP